MFPTFLRKGLNHIFSNAFHIIGFILEAGPVRDLRIHKRTVSKKNHWRAVAVLVSVPRKVFKNVKVWFGHVIDPTNLCTEFIAFSVFQLSLKIDFQTPH